MKKILCVLFALLLAVSGAVLSGCTEKPAVDTTTAAATDSITDTGTEPAGETLSYGIFLYDRGSLSSL